MSAPLNIVLLNGIAGALDFDADAETVPDALNVIAAGYGEGGPFGTNLEALNAIGAHVFGAPQSFDTNLDAINGIVGELSGDPSSVTYFPDGLLAWSNEIATGLVYTDENGFPYQDENADFITAI